ncbi:MAG: hypothetical protein EOP50_02805 [Sphingobacteriales bacterium]|nr:MAG: hypothetical protein EOP50_02805 [Sphingobacteriales bacterium]
MVYPVLAYQAIDWNSVNERPLGYFGYPLLIAAGLLLFCWKYREKRLVRVRTKLDKRQSRAAVVRFLQQDGFAIIRNNKDFVVAVSDEGAFEWPRQLTVLFEDGCCHINVLTLGRDSRMPSFFKKREYVQQLKGVLSEAARVSSEPLH